MANDGHADAGEGVYNVNDAENNSYPGSSAYPNIENSNTMIQDHHQGLGPYGYSHSAWYPGAAGNILYLQPDYSYPSPPPATTMNINMNGYYFNEYDGYYYYYHPPTDGFYPLQPQPQFHVQPQPVFDARRRGNFRDAHSTGRNSNSLQEAGRGRLFECQVSRDYSNAKFFVIKSNSRENVVSSIKHSMWTCTHRGNRILNAAYRESGHNAIFLFFSVIL